MRAFIHGIFLGDKGGSNLTFNIVVISRLAAIGL
jgi:hypothetical protein